MASYRENLKEEEKVFLSLLKKELFHIEEPYDHEIDWNAVVEESIQQSCFLSAFSHIDQTEALPSEIQREIMKRSGSYLKANLMNVQWHGQVHSMMQKLGIPYCILKGAASARYYQEPLLRQMGDVDFLVRKQDLEKVGKFLESKGFSCLKMKEYHHHIDYQKGNICLEVHFDPPGIPKGEIEPVVRSYLQDLLEKSHVAEELSFPVRVPSDFHHGLVMLLHLSSHLMGAGIGIRHLCDWALFLNSIEEKEFLKLFQEPLQNMGLWVFAQTISLTSVLAFGLERQNWMGTQEELAGALLVDIMAGGNNGRKEEQRIYEAMFISDARRLNMQTGRIHQLFGSMNEKAYTTWPMMKHCKILLPVGWVLLYIRRVYRVLTGKRAKMNYFKVYKDSYQRKELYQQLHIFER